MIKISLFAEIAGRIYWLDITRMGDENLDAFPVPNFRWALPIRAQGAGLEPLTPKPPALPLGKMILKVDARGGIGKPTPLHEELIVRGDAALWPAWTTAERPPSRKAA